MRYTILGFQQQKLIDNNLDMVDALILRTIKDMYSSAGMEFIIEDNEKYMWVKVDYLLNQIPIIGSRSNLTRKIKKYEDNGFLKKLFKHTKNGIKGSFAYIAPTIKLDSLQDFEGYVNLTQGVGQSDIGGRSKRPTKDTSIKDTSIKDNNTMDYKSIYDYYLTLDLVKHRQYTNDIAKAITKAVKDNKYDIDYCKTLLKRHEEVVHITKKSNYPVRARGLAEFFGQKAYQATHLICSEYEEGGKLYEEHLKNKKEVKEIKPLKMVMRDDY